MHIQKVSTDEDAKFFLELPKVIYANEANYILPLNKDVEEVFDPEKNKAFRFGKLERWLVYIEKECIGRIAVFVNKKYRNKGDEGVVGGIGFFECINDQKAANLLFDTAKKWLQEQGCYAMDGPINFGERDRWWGLVVKGFMEPLYCMNYNLPYYKDLFENYGFRVYFEQVCFDMDPKAPLQEKMWKRHDEIAKDPDFSSSHLQKNNLEKFAGDFVEVYNKAWAGHGGLKQMEKKAALILFQKMKPVMDEKVIWFAYHKQDPIAMFVNLPDLNQWFKFLNGKFDIIHKLKFLWIKFTKPNKKFTGLVFGVVPEWQGKGVDAYIVGETAKYVQSSACKYEQYEMQWIGDFNPKMLNVAQALGDVKQSRKLCTYRYIFDRNKPFERHPILH